MAYDDVILKLGEFGSYQRIIYFLICLTSIPCAFHKLAGNFLLAKPDFRCVLPFEEAAAAANSSVTIRYDALPAHVWALAYPRDPLTHKFKTCEYYNVTYDAKYLAHAEPLLVNGTIACTRYVYDDSVYESSIVTEWDLVCGYEFLAATSDLFFMLGVLIGSIIFGYLSDKYGRRPIFFVSLVTQVVSGVLAGVAPEYISYTAARLIVGATTSGVFLVAYVIAMEMVGPSKRLFAGIFVMMFFSFGYMLTAAFAYFIHDWRTLQIALTLPGLIFMFYYWTVPESVRWLLSKGRKAEAIANIQKMARFNKVEISDDLLNTLLEEHLVEDNGKTEAKEASVFDLLRYPNLRRKTLLIFFDWFINSGTYYGLSWNTNNLGGNALLNFVIAGAVEVPAYTFLLLTLDKWGRRSILCGSMLLAGTSLLLTMFVPIDMNWLMIVFAMLGKLAITSSYGTVYIFSAEQFPTVVRNVGLGASSMVARIAGMLASYIKLLADIWRPLPLIILGALVLVGGLLSLLLPETHNKPTLETIADGEQFGKKRKANEYVETGRELQSQHLKLEEVPLNSEQNGVTNGRNH